MSKHIYISRIIFPASISGNMIYLSNIQNAQIGDLIEGYFRGKHIIGVISSVDKSKKGKYDLIKIDLKDKKYYWDWVESQYTLATSQRRK